MICFGVEQLVTMRKAIIKTLKTIYYKQYKTKIFSGDYKKGITSGSKKELGTLSATIQEVDYFSIIIF